MKLITVMVLVAAALAAYSLFEGVVSMAHGGEDDDARSPGLMLRRVGWQALAVLLVGLSLLAIE